MSLLQFFRLFHNISDENYQLLTDHFQSRSFKKNEFITVPGQVQKEIYFVEKGTQMSYFENEDKIHVIAFTYPPNISAIPDSFYFQSPSQYYLKCLTDSEMQYLHYETINTLFDRSQEIERLFRKMTEAVLSGIINRHTELQTLSMEERFKAFCKRSPQLLQLVPHKYIASYLGIDSTNFSKLFNSVKI